MLKRIMQDDIRVGLESLQVNQMADLSRLDTLVLETCASCMLIQSFVQKFSELETPLPVFPFQSLFLNCSILESYLITS